jgi:NOL1/NOP2/fmu family ribosome biogenesis protein
MAKANANNNQDSQTTALEQKRKELIVDILKLRNEERSALAKGIELSKAEKQGLNSKTKQLKKI